MTTARIALIAAGALAAAIALAAPARAQMYGLGTGKQGFFTYSAGAAIAKVAADNGMNLRLQPYGGTSAYVPGVNAGEIEFGLANELETHYAVTGQVIYKDKPQADLRVIAVLTPLYSEFFVRKDSPIKTIADLKGKRVPTDYVSQRVLDVLTKGTLANGNLTYADMQKVPVPNVVGGADEFAQGKADIFMFALGSGKVSEVDAQVGGVRVLPIDPSPEAMARLRKIHSGRLCHQARARQGPRRRRSSRPGSMPTTIWCWRTPRCPTTRSTNSPRSCTTTRRPWRPGSARSAASTPSA